MKGDAFTYFLALPECDRRDVFDTAARRLETAPHYAEKDFRVCLVLAALFHGPPADPPGLLSHHPPDRRPREA